MAKQGPKVQIAVKPGANEYRAFDISRFDRRPQAEYYREAGRFRNVENHVYYDTAVYAAAAISQQHTARLFQNGMADQGVVANTGTVIAEKGEFLTNMATNGEFDNSTSFFLECISVELFLASEVPTTLSTKNAITAPAHSAIATYSAALHYQMITRQMKLEFFRADQLIVAGLLYEFPSPFVASGAFGSSLGGFIQNGFAVPTWNKLAEIHALESNERFSCRITPLEGFTPQVAFNIKVNFIGKKLTTLYS